MSVEGVIKAASEPVKVLTNAVSGAIGKAYEPRHIRRMADAKAYEINKISESIRNNADLPIVYDENGKYTIDISDYQDLMNRAGKRLAYREIQKQENIEAIIDKAYDDVKDSPQKVEGEITREWMNRFIDSAGDVSNEELRNLWSKVLAGQVLKPSSFSLRTLECLKNIEPREAKLFEQLCEVAIAGAFVPNDMPFLKGHGLTYDDVLNLDEIGLLNSSGTIEHSADLGKEWSEAIDFGEYLLLGRTDVKKKFSISAFPFTLAGKELFSIVGKAPTTEITKEICAKMRRKHPAIEFKLEHVTSRENGEANTDGISIPF